MRTLTKTIMVTITIALFLHNIGILQGVLQTIILAPILFTLLAIPYALLTNLILPAPRTPRPTSRKNDDYAE